jgi:Ca-activated chloride channel family protein
MEFARPDLFYLLVAVPFAAFLIGWAARRRRDQVALLGTPALVRALSSSLNTTRRRCRIVLWLVALAAIVVAAARPRWGIQLEMTVQRGVQVMAVLDVSTSMTAEDLKPNRLARAKLSLQELMDRLAGNEIGLVLFSGAAFVQVPLTNDLNTARAFLDAAEPTDISRPGTDLEKALQVAIGAFPQEIEADRAILLLTDGEGHEGDPIITADVAARSAIPIFAIGFGAPDGEPIPLRDASDRLLGYKKGPGGEPVLSRLDEPLLQRIAQRTGGRYFRASAAGDEIETIASEITRSDAEEQQLPFEVRRVERFEWFAGLAFLALGGEYLLSERTRRERGPEVDRDG